jgi:hypothetical protein
MSFHWTKSAIERLVTWSLDGDSSRAIAARLGCIERTVRDMQFELELAKPMERRPWTRQEKRVLRSLYPDTKTESIAQQLGRALTQVYQQAAKLGLAKSETYMASPAACRLRRGEHPGLATQFKKGLVPHNKGLRRPGWAPGRMRETQFKKGERRGAAARNWCPVGTVRPDADGFLRIKVRESNAQDKCFGFGNVSIWPMLQRHVWQQHHGPIPAQHKVVFRDGDRSRCVIENLELVSDAELMRRNSIHHRYPKEMVNTIMLLGAVKRKLRERSEKYDNGSAQPSV